MGIQERIKKLNEKGFQSQIESFIEKLEEKASLPKDLKEILDKVKNNPIEEPKIFKLVENNSGFSEIIIAILSSGNKKTKPTLKKEVVEMCSKYSLDEVVLFAKLAVEKVTDIYELDGSVKSTPNTENCNLPNIFEAEEYSKAQKDWYDMLDEYRELVSDNINKEKIENLDNRVKKASEDLDKLAEKISGLDFSKLIEWEKKVVLAQITQAVNKAYTKTSLGKHLSF
jgi:DNA-binding transcriptional regulator GbsR (MarR family)